MFRAEGINSRIERMFLLAALFLWLICLPLPAVDVRGGPSFSGYDVLVQGWSAWRNGVFSWFANPLLFIAVFSAWYGRFRVAAVAALCAVLLALTSLWAPSIARAGGMSVPELSFRIGFYCWIAAYLAAVGGSIVGFLRCRSARQER